MLPRLCREVFHECTERNMGHIRSSHTQTGNSGRLHFRFQIILPRKSVEFKHLPFHVLGDWFKLYNLGHSSKGTCTCTLAKFKI